MSWWLWLFLGAVFSLLFASFYPIYITINKIKSLKKDVSKTPESLGDFDGEIDIFIPLEMVKIVTDEELKKRKGLITYNVSYSKDEKWQIKRGGNKAVYAEGKNKKLIVRLAKLYAKKDKAELKIHDKKGRIKISNSYGNDPKGNG
jgi:hypothetical protein